MPEYVRIRTGDSIGFHTNSYNDYTFLVMQSHFDCNYYAIGNGNNVRQFRIPELIADRIDLDPFTNGSDIEYRYHESEIRILIPLGESTR